MATIYETRVMCDNCGRLVSQQRVDPATFERLVQKMEPDEDDLYDEDQARAVSVVVTRVPVCSRCKDRT